MLGIHFSFHNSASHFFPGTQWHSGTRFTASEWHILTKCPTCAWLHCSAHYGMTPLWGWLHEIWAPPMAQHKVSERTRSLFILQDYLSYYMLTAGHAWDYSITHDAVPPTSHPHPALGIRPALKLSSSEHDFVHWYHPNRTPNKEPPSIHLSSPSKRRPMPHTPNPIPPLPTTSRLRTRPRMPTSRFWHTTH